jgi:hypothetical protein
MPQVFVVWTTITLVLSLGGLTAAVWDSGDNVVVSSVEGIAGAHHTYGHNDSWRVLPTWKQALDAPGAVQMGILRKVFEARDEWWQLVPDQSILVRGGNTEGTVLNLAARHKDGRWLMVYLGDKATFTIDRSKFTAGSIANASWIDPRTGKSISIGEVPNNGVQRLTTPEGWEDALLILELPGGRARVAQ